MRRYPKLFLTVLTIVFLVPFVDSTFADGPLRRLFRGGRVSQSSHQATGYVCENGICYPTQSTSVVYSTPVYASAQTVPIPTAAPALPETVSVIEVGDSKFGRAIVSAAIKAQRSGAISRIELMKLRVAMLSPAFRNRAEDLALIQVSASGEDLPFTLTADGTIDRTSIDWDGLAVFLEKLIPLILTLLKAFGV